MRFFAPCPAPSRQALRNSDFIAASNAAALGTLARSDPRAKLGWRNLEAVQYSKIEFSDDRKACLRARLGSQWFFS
jgi:hypothetical protein